LDEGPRKPGHSGSPAKAQVARKSDAMTLFMILLDYKYRQTSRIAPPRGQDASAGSPIGTVQRTMPATARFPRTPFLDDIRAADKPRTEH
jgi:hypothetical protein